MAEATRGMGRGLSAILSSNTQTSRNSSDNGNFRELEIENVVPNPDQPRRKFAEDALVALADSIRERGVIQPVLVRSLHNGKYQVIAGERRWRAAKLAGLAKIPAVISVHDDGESLEVGLIENMVRQDLTPIEEARACALLVEEFSLTREEIGRRVGRSRAAVSNLLRLLDLPDEVIEALDDGQLTEGHGRAILLAADHEGRRRLGRAAIRQGWTVRQTEAQAKNLSQSSKTTNSRSASGRTSPNTDPDQLAAADQLSERLSIALGCEVSVIPHDVGFRISTVVNSYKQAVRIVEQIES